MRRFLFAFLLIPLTALAWQARRWPKIRDPSALVTLAEEKTAQRERYRSKNPKLDFAFLPQEEWTPEVKELKPQDVMIERGYLLVALVLTPEETQAIAVIADEAAFRKAKDTWIVEETSDVRIKRVFSKRE